MDQTIGFRSQCSWRGKGGSKREPFRIAFATILFAASVKWIPSQLTYSRGSAQALASILPHKILGL